MTVLRSVTSGGAAGAPNEIFDHTVDGAVVDHVLTTLSSVTISGTKRITSVVLSGSDYAKFFCVVDAAVIAIKRSGPARNVEFFLNLQLTDGQIFETKVLQRTGANDTIFESTVLGF